MSGWVMVRDEVRKAVEKIADAGEGWRRAYDNWQKAVRERNRLAGRMERRVKEATGGLSVAAFEVACRRRYFHDVKDAKSKAAAIRARPAVTAAVAERDRLLAGADAKVVAARMVLAEESKAMAGYGTVGLDMTGLGAPELRRLARRPPMT
jgi:hypothetical protein